MSFTDIVSEAAAKFKENLPESVTIVSDYDTDGLCSHAILKQALESAGCAVTSHIVQYVNADVIKQIPASQAYIFSDCGSNNIDDIAKLKGQIFILDHHQSDAKENEKIVHLNPYLHGETENQIISASGIAYFFTLALDPKNRSLAYISVIGALGDGQEKNGFSEYNNTILQHAVIQKTIQIGKRLKLYGINSRPLLKVLEYSSDLNIPGVTNNPQGAKQLLRDLNIFYTFKPKPGQEKPRFRKYYHLRPDEKERLHERIIELLGDVDHESIFIPSYTLPNEKTRELQDGKEFATIINACGRLGNYDLALDILDNDEHAKEQAGKTLWEYKTKLREVTTELLDEQNSLLETTETYACCDLETKVPAAMAGIVASMLARNRHFPEGVVVCTTAQLDKFSTKISLRVSNDNQGLQLNEVIKELTKDFCISCGGHDNAAGAVIPSEQKEKFLENFKAHFA